MADVLSHFKEVADEDDNITEEAFDELFEKYVGTNLSQDDADKLHLILGRLFDMFDEDNNQLISYSEFATGISILCQGTRDERAKAAFQVVDEDGDGHIDLDELTKYLSSVFRIMYEVEPATEQQMGTDYHTLAKVTAGEAFKEADKDTNGVLSYDEFRAWYVVVRLIYRFVFVLCSSYVRLKCTFTRPTNKHTQTNKQQVQLGRRKLRTRNTRKRPEQFSL